MANRPKDLDVWVLAGQSNMQGCGWLAGAMEPDERVRAFTMAGKWEVAAEPLHRLWESFTPVHKDMMRPWLPAADKKLSDRELAAREAKTRTNGSGLGIAFGRAMADVLGKPVGVIPAAHGGTSLDQWSHKLKDQGGRSLYGAMLQRIARAGGRLRGLLWYQGESDAFSPDAGRSYAARFDEWIAALRKDTGVKDLPVVAVQIGRVFEPADRQGFWPGWDYVREALGTLPRRVPHTAVTSAVDVGNVDGIHIDTPGLIRLGRRLARLALKLTDRPGMPGGPVVKSIARAVTPAGGHNSLLLRCTGLAGPWLQEQNIPGFQVCVPEPAYRNPLLVVNTYIDHTVSPDGTALRVLLNRDPDPDAKLAYGLGLSPTCHLVDHADMPLCTFLPRPIKA